MININKIREEVSTFEDKLGQKVDKDIFEAVVALRLHGFNTVSSCAGHVKQKTLCFTPHIDITDTTKESHIDQYKANVEKLSKLINLLDEFYQNRKTDYKNMLVCSCSWGNAAFIELRPHSGLTSAYEVINLQARQELHKQYLKEFKDFAKFLIEKKEHI